MLPEALLPCETLPSSLPLLPSGELLPEGRLLRGSQGLRSCLLRKDLLQEVLPRKALPLPLPPCALLPSSGLLREGRLLRGSQGLRPGLLQITYGVPGCQ
ncbi:MAG: hypothetical protein ACWGMZ_01705 [Thermoguttaceae bacterium]